MRPVVIYCGAHLGYDPYKEPIGGGAAVAHALINRWVQLDQFDLIVIGTGPTPPTKDLNYLQITPEQIKSPAELSVREYTQFSISFSQRMIDYLMKNKYDLDPTKAIVLHNDVVEAADFKKVARLGFKQATIIHVDVVDYVANIYLYGLFQAPILAKLWRFVRSVGIHKILPKIFKLIFEKQQQCVYWSDLLILPSQQMASIITATYPTVDPQKIIIKGWGTILEPPSQDISVDIENIRKSLSLNGSPVLVCLSRISPEKGQDLLLRALQIWDRRKRSKLILLICGKPAYMHGLKYMEKLYHLASKLKNIQVHFLGHISGPIKEAVFKLADLYVFPSRHESYGLTIMEAMAAGLPVLSTNHRSAKDIINSSVGLVVEATPMAIFNGLEELLKDKARLKIMGQKAREFALTHSFDQTAAFIATRLLNLLRPT